MKVFRFYRQIIADKVWMHHRFEMRFASLKINFPQGASRFPKRKFVGVRLQSE
jgi:hypothetical protein